MMGPLISAKQLHNVQTLVEDAIDRGVIVETGGQRMSGASPLDGFDFSQGYFYPPTILTDSTTVSVVDARIWKEEAFGPVIVVVGFDDETDALELANDSEFGLGAALWTSDLSQAHRMSDGIEAGICWGESSLGRPTPAPVLTLHVTVNTHHRNDPSSPWGGIHNSGVGSENGIGEFPTLLQTALRSCSLADIIVDAYRAYTSTKSTIMNYASDEHSLASDDWFGEAAGTVRYG